MISYLDMPTVIPDGRVLVHNHARPTRRLGSTGFRAWSEPGPASEHLELCPCYWAPELGRHYRVKVLARGSLAWLVHEWSPKLDSVELFELIRRHHPHVTVSMVVEELRRQAAADREAIALERRRAENDDNEAASQ
jgi:hypothetical protein